MTAGAALAVLRIRRGPLAPEEVFSIEDGALVRRIGRRETRWPLSGLRRMTLGARRSPYAARTRFVRLRLGRAPLALACGPGDMGYAAFVRTLAAEAARHAPEARFRAEGSPLAGVVTTAVALLSAGAVAMGLAAFMAGLIPLGLDLAARLAFLLILIFAVTPWIGRAGPRLLDPRALPDELVA